MEEYSDIYCFPPEIRTDKEHFHLTLIGYTEDQQMALTQLMGNEDVEELIVKIFSKHNEVAYLHARSVEACCYICKIERAQECISQNILK